MTIATLNPAITQMEPPPIPLIQQAAKRYDGRAGPIIDLSQAVPGYPPHSDLLDWLSTAAGSTDALGYGDIQGETDLRSAYADHVSARYGTMILSGETQITAGCNQAFVASALTVAGQGDSLLLISPYYFNHETTLAMLGIGVKTFRTVANTGFLPDAQDLAAAIAPDVKAICIVSPNNPTGAIYPPDLLAHLFDVCAAKNIWLIIDETYRDFHPLETRSPHNLFAKPNWRDHFVQLYSFSKSFCIPGHRVGAIVAGEEVIAQISKVMDNLQICAPRAPQIAVAKGLRHLDDWQRQNRAEIAARATALQTTFEQLPNWKIISMGAYFAYIRHPFGDETAERVASRLAEETGIITLPGSYFGPDQENYLRFAFANVDSQQIAALAVRLRE